MNVLEKENLKGLIAGILADAGLDLVDLKISFHLKDWTIQVLTDKPEGGVRLEDCGTVNKEIRNLLEMSFENADNISLEVSSPGVDWPLKTRKDFMRAKEKKVAFYLSEELEGEKQYQGIIGEAGRDSVRVSVKNGIIEIPYELIDKAIQVIV